MIKSIQNFVNIFLNKRASEGRVVEKANYPAPGQITIQSTIARATEISLEDWFKEHKVSTRVKEKHIPLDRHVFDIKRLNLEAVK